MKTVTSILLGVLALSTSHGQLTLTGFDRNGLLSWTNHLCTTRPVYEVLGAGSPTGTWAHVAFVTNQTSVLTALPAPNTSRFYQLRWADDAPLQLNYEYDEGLGMECPAAIGTLSLTFHSFQQAGTGVFSLTACSLFDEHPEGTKQLLGVWYGVDQLAIFLETSPDNRVWLEGEIERSSPSGTCSFTRYSGIVWAETFTEVLPIGTFIATAAR